MRHIGLITTSYPDGVPGSEAAGGFVADFSAELARHVRVSVIAPATASSRTNSGTLDVIRFGVPQVPLSLLNPLNPADWPAIVMTLRSGRRVVEQLVQADSPDHLFGLWVLPSGYWAWAAGQNHGIPFSVWALGSDIWSLGRVPIARAMLRRTLKRAKRRYADGIRLSRDVERLSGLDCQFLPSTRSLPQFEASTKADTPPYNLGFLGRWHRNKGIDLLMEALDLLSDSDWSRIAEIRIHGGGPMEQELRDAVREQHEMRRPVRMGGYLDKHEAAALIDWADYLLLPSRIESIPVVFSDAVQLGTPIIATPVGDLPRLYEKYRFGTLASAANSAAFAAAIQNALAQSAAHDATRIAAAKPDFDLRTIVKQFVDDTVDNAP